VSRADRQQHVTLAREAVARRVDRYRSDAPQELELLLDRLVEYVLSPATKAVNVLTKAGLGNVESKQIFERLVGVAPIKFINELRVHAAKPLLTKTDLGISEISRLVGFSNATYFSQVFKEFEGSKPTDFRAHERSGRKAKIALDEEKISESCVRGLLRGVGSDRAEIHLIEVLAAIRSPTRFSQEMKAIPRTDLRKLEDALARHLLASSKQSTNVHLEAEILELSSCFQTPALFYQLLEASRTEGRADRLRGEFVAEVALTSLRSLGWRLSEEEVAHLQARGWAWLGSARELAEDLSGAEAALNQAEALLSAFPPGPIRVRAELAYFRSCLRTRQCRVPEALTLASQALELAEEFECPELRAEILIARGGAAGSVGDWEPALQDFQNAASQLDEFSDSHLQVAARHGVAAAALKTGRLPLAREEAQQARSLATTAGDESVLPALHWIEGLIASDLGEDLEAERLYRIARNSFLQVGNQRNCALVSLDLAAVLARTERSREISTLVGSTLPILACLKLDQEGIVLIRMLQEAAGRENVNLEIVSRLRNYLGRILDAPELDESCDHKRSAVELSES